MARGFGTTSGVGTTDVIATPYTTDIVAGGKRCWSVWVYWDGAVSGGNLGRIFSKKAGANPESETWFVGTVSFQIEYGANALNTTTAETCAFPSTPNIWHHLFVNVDCSSGGVAGGPNIIYVDGVAQTMGTIAVTVGANSDPVLIGNRSDALRNWSGRLANLAMWDGINLTAGEITALAKGALPLQIRRGSLTIWLPLDGLQSPEPDFSGNNNNGTLTGTAKIFGPPVMQFTPRWPQFWFPPPAPPPVFSLMPQIVT